MWVVLIEGKEEVSGDTRESVFRMLRKVPFPVDLLRFVSGRTFHISSLSNAHVQVSPTF